MTDAALPDQPLPRTVLTETSRYDLTLGPEGRSWIRRTPGAGLGTLAGAGHTAVVLGLELDDLWEPVLEVVQLELGAPMLLLVLRDGEPVARGSTLVREIHWPVGVRCCEHVTHLAPAPDGQAT